MGLRICEFVDASIFPLEPRGNIQSSVYAVAERASAIIKGVLYLNLQDLAANMRQI